MGLILAIILASIMAIVNQKYHMMHLPQMNIDEAIHRADEDAKWLVWESTPDYHYKKLRISYESWTQVELTFVPRPNGTIDVYYIVNFTGSGWVLVALASVFLSLIGFLIVYSIYSSGRHFSYYEVYPMLYHQFWVKHSSNDKSKVTGPDPKETVDE